MNKKKLLKSLLTVVCMMMLMVPVLWSQSQDVYAAESYYTDYEEAKEYIREKLGNRETTITVRISPQLYNEYGFGIFTDAMEHVEGGNSKYGDALAFDYSSRSGSGRAYSTYYELTSNYTYYTTSAQEAQVDAAIKSAVASLNLAGKNDYQKILAIKTYICDNVDYDYTNLNVSSYKLKYTAYAALINKTAVCQGYAVLFYRMAMEAGLDARVISGTSNGGGHAWNIVRIGDYYYNIDCTWDGQNAATTSRWFVLNNSEFVNHIRDDKYNTDEFNAAYPMASDSYFDYSTLTKNNYPNSSTFTYNLIDGTTTTSQAEGRPKVLIFYRTTCSNSQSTIKSVCEDTPAGVDIIAIDIDGKDLATIKSFKNTYGNDNIKFQYGSDYSLWRYVLMFDPDAESTGLPTVVYIDGDNKVQYLTVYASSASAIEDNLERYCSSLVWSLSFTDKLEVDETTSVKVYCNGESKNAQFFSWKTLDSSVATVDSYGKVTAVGSGRTTVVCYAGDNTIATREITVAGNSILVDEYGNPIASDYTGIAQNESGWWYVTNGVIDTSYTGIASNSNGWWRIENGQVNFEYTGLASNSAGWWYLEGGKVNFNYTGAVEYGGNTWYVINGKLDSDYTGIRNDGTYFWYVVKGKINTSFVGLYNYAGAWWYIVDGKIQTGYKGMVEYSGYTWYVAAGKVDITFTGLGLHEGTWYCVQAGKVNMSYSGLVYNGDAWWYVTDGVLDTSVTGIVETGGSQWLVGTGKLQSGYTGNYVYNGTTYVIVNGKVTGTK